MFFRLHLTPKKFRRYHQSEVRLKASTKVSSGFWSDSSLAEVDGKQVVVKRYDKSDSVNVSQATQLVEDVTDPNSRSGFMMSSDFANSSKISIVKWIVLLTTCHSAIPTFRK